jgi:glycogen debranching enzyme
MHSVVDIVLNHTANNSSWIVDHPEACYSTDNVPKLWPGFLLDQELQNISAEFAKGNCSWCRSAPNLRNESDLGQVITEMARRSHSLNLHEFFLIQFD